MASRVFCCLGLSIAANLLPIPITSLNEFFSQFEGLYPTAPKRTVPPHICVVNFLEELYRAETAAPQRLDK